jgi:hypothetical protein
LARPEISALDAKRCQLALKVSPAAVHVALAVLALLGDESLDLLVLARVQRCEGKVLELPLDRVDAEAMGDRRVDLKRLAWPYRVCFCLGSAPIVRMLCSLSASLIRITRTSSAIATIILR